MKREFIRQWFAIQFILSFSLCVHGQETFIYDQQSADENTGGGAIIPVQSSQPLGQSFTPTLPSVGFIRLFVGGGLGTAFYVNLRTSSITGPILGSSDFVSFLGNFTGYTNVFFYTPVAVTPGVPYYFQPILQSGGGVVVGYNYGYPGGTAFINGTADSFSDLWFREGIVVPEPSSVLLILVGFGALVYVRHTKQS